GFCLPGLAGCSGIPRDACLWIQQSFGARFAPQPRRIDPMQTQDRLLLTNAKDGEEIARRRRLCDTGSHGRPRCGWAVRSSDVLASSRRSCKTDRAVRAAPVKARPAHRSLMAAALMVTKGG